MAKLKRTIINKRLWLSFIAIVKFVPHALTLKPNDGMKFFTEETCQDFSTRVERMTRDAPRQWGTMNAAQMLHHLNLAVGGALGYYDLPDESYLLSRTLFKWILVDWFAEQPKGLRLPLNFVINLSDQFDFDHEKKLLLEILNKACHVKSASEYGPHVLFGKMSLKEWGKLSLIHIDYHLK